MIMELVLFVLLFFNTFVLKNIDRTYTLVIVIFFLILTLVKVKYKKPIGNRNLITYYVIGGISLLTIGLLYIFGIFDGFSLGYGLFSKRSIGVVNILIIFAIVVVTELIRYVLSLQNCKNKKICFIKNIIMLMCYVFIDLSIDDRIYGFNGFKQICEFICLFLVQSVSKNLFLINTSKKYGYGSCLIYRFIMDLYVYIVPIVPVVNTFINAVIFTVIPYVEYISLKNINEKKSIKLSKLRNKNFNYAFNMLELVVIGILVALVSCEFKYGMLAVGSESMTGAINKGDAVIYERYNDKDNNKISDGQIIVFKKNSMMVVHRVYRSIPVDDGYFIYQTKGDANKNIDNWLVKPEEIVGLVNKRVLWIAWPSVLLNEMFG